MIRLSKVRYLITTTGCATLGFILVLAGHILNSHGSEDIGVPLWIFAFQIYVFSLIVGLVLIYRIWKSIQDGHARTTPAKAVLFLLIPLFNFYWIFQVWWGFARDCNQYIERHQVTIRKLPEWLFLTFCIVSLFWFLWWPIAISLVISFFLVGRVCDTLNQLPQPSHVASQVKPPELLRTTPFVRNEGVAQVKITKDMQKRLQKNERVIAKMSGTSNYWNSVDYYASNKRILKFHRPGWWIFLLGIFGLLVKKYYADESEYGSLSKITKGSNYPLPVLILGIAIGIPMLIIGLCFFTVWNSSNDSSFYGFIYTFLGLFMIAIFLWVKQSYYQFEFTDIGAKKAKDWRIYIPPFAWRANNIRLFIKLVEEKAGISTPVPTALKTESEKLIDMCKQDFVAKNEQELLAIWHLCDRDKYSEEQLEAVRQILNEHGHAFRIRK